MQNRHANKLKTSFDDHPLYNEDNLQLWTPAVEQLSEDIHRWVWTGITGGLIYGTYRIGKSRAIELLHDKIFTRSKIQVPFYYISIPDRDTNTIRSVFEELCYSVNLMIGRYENANVLSNRYINYILDENAKAKCKQAILIVDEMQRLSLKQFNAFAEIYDVLRHTGIRITIIFVGNDPDCWNIVNQITPDKHAHLYGRFFTQSAPFRGLTSKVQVAACLKQYDSLCYPHGGPTLTEFVLPYEVKNGWKVAALSGDLWRLYSDVKRTYKLKSWGIQYFTATIRTLLTDYLPRYGIDDIEDEMLNECIQLSGIIPSVITTKK